MDTTTSTDASSSKKLSRNAKNKKAFRARRKLKAKSLPIASDERTSFENSNAVKKESEVKKYEAKIETIKHHLRWEADKDTCDSLQVDLVKALKSKDACAKSAKRAHDRAELSDALVHAKKQKTD